MTDAFGLPVYNFGKKPAKNRFSNDYSRFEGITKDVPDDPRPPSATEWDEVMKKAKVADKVPKPGWSKDFNAQVKKASEITSKAGFASEKMRQQLQEMEKASEEIRRKEEELEKLSNPEDLVAFMRSQGLTDDDLHAAMSGDHSKMEKILDKQFKTDSMTEMVNTMDKAAEVADALNNNDMERADKKLQEAFESKQVAAASTKPAPTKAGGKPAKKGKAKASAFSFGAPRPDPAYNPDLSKPPEAAAAPDDYDSDDDPDPSRHPTLPPPCDESTADDPAQGREEPAHEVRVEDGATSISIALPKLPGGMKEVDLDVAATTLTLASSHHYLRLALPEEVDPDTSRAKWSKKTGTLKITVQLALEESLKETHLD